MMHLFEVSIYNELVRRANKDGESHPVYGDEWSDTHFIEVRAGNEQDARRKMHNRYPKDKGFVIGSVTLID